MLALAPRQSARDSTFDEIMMPGEILSDHFTPTDRERLITTSVNLGNLAREFGELKQAITAHQTANKIDSDRFEAAYKADGERMDERVRALENFRWWILGASAGCGALFGLIGSRLFH